MGKDGETKATGTLISSVLCPECQGTGIDVEGDELEKPDVSLSQVCISDLKTIRCCCTRKLAGVCFFQNE